MKCLGNDATVIYTLEIFKNFQANGLFCYLLFAGFFIRLKQVANKSSAVMPHIRKLMKYCPDVWTQYKIAMDLGLQDITKELVRSDSCGSYIKDMLASQP